MARLKIVFTIACIFQAVEAGWLLDGRGSVSIQENYDDSHDLWTLNVRCIYYDWYCDACTITSDSSGHFTTSGRTLQKKVCMNKYCGPTCSSPGCLNGGRSHRISLKCYTNYYGSYDEVTTSITVDVTTANEPSFSFSESNYIEIVHDTVGQGSVINKIIPTTSDNSYDYDYARYRQSRSPGVSYLHQTPDLFALDTSTGEIKVMKSLEYEFDYFFDMEVCVYDRRNRQDCQQLDIKLWACFQTPNCSNQEELSLHDTFGTYTGHGGSSNVVFSQKYPLPSGHFASAFRSTWQTLTWTFDPPSEFPELAVGLYSGDIYITKNISIWPAWPTKDYTVTVRMANSDSCYTTTCNFFIRVHYTNWPIEIRSLPNNPQYEQNEDNDNGYLIHNLVVYDYNYESEDNITCKIHRISPHEDFLFRLDHDGRFKWDSYTLHKEVCQNPKCGYKHPLLSEFQHSAWQRFYCDTDIGCLTYNRTQQYTVTIKCDDAYNTTDEKDFTFNVIKNQVPSYRHLPTFVDLDKHKVSKYDIIFEIMYWDNENEDLIYEYTYEDVDNPGHDPEYFLGSERGNYWDNLGNITMIEYLWDKDSNTSYRIHICGHERRNEICEDLIVNVQEYCSETPTCNDSSTTVDTTTEVNFTLFDMSSLVNPSQTETFDKLTYSIKAPNGNLFKLDSGKIQSARTFPEVYPSATYTIVGYVYNAGACGTGTCQLTVNVDFVNHPISITNVAGTTVSIHEDETSVKILFTVAVSDDNTIDSYTCNLTSTDNGPFHLDRSPPTTGLYYLKNRQNYALTSDPAVYYITITCYDQYGSSDTFTVEIDIEPNLAPQFDNATDWTTKNVYIEKAEKGDLVFWISASDKENDDIEWTCTVDANINPLACSVYPTYIKIYLRRAINMDFDDGRTADVKVCIADAKHPSSSDPSLCRSLSVSFSLTLTEPWISNTNDWPLTMTEDTDISTVLWTADVQNPDTGESTTVIMNVYPDTYSNYFKFNQDTKELFLAKQVDYEQIQKIRFEFAVKDTHLMGLQNYTVFLNIANVNEGNTLTAENIEISFPEDTAPNSVLPDLGLTCMDIDGDDVTLSIIEGFNYTGYFSLNSSTGELVLLKEWDLESGITSETSIVIQCSDPDGETSTVVIDITVTDVNEFEPICSIYFIAERPLVISPHTSLSKVLLTIVCTDPDRDADGSFNVAPLGLGFASRYFRMLLRTDRKRSTGSTYIDVKLKDTIDLSNDKSFEATFMISDAAGNPLFTGISIEVNFTSADPDAKSKESARSLTSTKEGKVIIVVLVIEGVVIVLLIIHACCSMMCHKNKVLRFKDLDVSRNKRFKSPRKERNSRVNKTSIYQTPFMTPSSVHVHQTNTMVHKTERKEVSSSDSSSGNDSDDYEQQNRREVSNIKFPTGMEVKTLGTGLPPKYSSGPTVQATGRHTQVSQQASGLPLPVYSFTVNSHHGSFPGFNQ